MKGRVLFHPRDEHGWYLPTDFSGEFALRRIRGVASWYRSERRQAGETGIWYDHEAGLPTSFWTTIAPHLK